MSKKTIVWALAAGLLVLGAAASHAFVTAAPATVAPPAPEVGVIGPDVIVGDLYDIRRFGTLNNMTAFAVGTISCNVGDMNLDWIAGNNLHPVIGQNLYRVDGDRIQQIGLSWLKHGFTALNENLCDTCNPTPGNSLGVGCSDPYSGGLNGQQSNLGPRSEVNAYNGVYPYPYGGQSAQNVLDKRIQVLNTDLDTSMNPGARYFLEGHYITQDDAQWGNGANNASYREASSSGTGSSVFLNWNGITRRTLPAIFAWNEVDPSVVVTKVEIPNEGLLYVGVKATDNGDGTWHYEYALFNLNSDRSVRAFAVQIPGGVSAGGFGSYVPPYHTGEPYPTTPWVTGVKQGYRYFASAQSFAQNPDANALRWSTMANFWFDADSAPTSGGSLAVKFFKPGTPGKIFWTGTAPQ